MFRIISYHLLIIRLTCIDIEISYFKQRKLLGFVQVVEVKYLRCAFKTTCKYQNAFNLWLVFEGMSIGLSVISIMNWMIKIVSYVF